MKGHGRQLPAVSATTARSRMGARVMASGMPVGIRLCGVRRRHLFGCQGALSVLMGAGRPRLRDYQRRIHTARVQRGGVNPRPCARGYRVTVPFGKRIICDGTGLKLALVESIAQEFWHVTRGSTKGDCQNQDLQDFGIFRIGLWRQPDLQGGGHMFYAVCGMGPVGPHPLGCAGAWVWVWLGEDDGRYAGADRRRSRGRVEEEGQRQERRRGWEGLFRFACRVRLRDAGG